MLQQGGKCPGVHSQHFHPLDAESNIAHPWPWVRFDARYSRKEPYEVVPQVRICAGGAG